MKILFLCVANSARSQMAEGLAKSIFKGRHEVLSAGSSPTVVNPFAIKVMHELGIDISSQYSKSICDVLSGDIDLVVTLCDDEVCPIVPRGTVKEHWPFEDPGGRGKGEDEILASFRLVRDQIQTRLREFSKAIGE